MKNVPDDYYRRLHGVESTHWWHVGMREVAAAVLGEKLDARNQSLLDAGCGTGGFLSWAAGTGAFGRLAGLDVSPEAIAIAGEAVPQAELRVAPLDRIPFESTSFDVVVVNDVLQHVEERELRPGLGEIQRVLRPDGVLLVRTNGGRTARRERSDWRLYDAETLRRELEQAGFRVERITYVNMLPSLWGSLRRRAPAPSTHERSGIPGGAGAITGAVGRAVLAVEARCLRFRRCRLPYGHTLVALARRAEA